jgi:hypothetical protein
MFNEWESEFLLLIREEKQKYGNVNNFVNKSLETYFKEGYSPIQAFNEKCLGYLD